MSILKMTDIDLSGKNVLIRQDYNVPIKDGRITSDKRIIASIPTIIHALDAGAKVMIMSHLGRPVEGQFDEKHSLRPAAERLSELMGRKIRLVKDWLNGVEMADGEIVVFENVRFNKGEKNDDEALSRKMAALCDVYVMDAFGTAHRAQASTHGIAKYAPVSCAGPLLAAELYALKKALKNPVRPMLAIVGGSKVSTKLPLLDRLSKVVDQLIVGGGIANTFIASEGYPVGKSLYEKDLVDEAKKLRLKAKDRGSEIPVPTDVVCGKKFEETADAALKKVDELESDDMIFDVGPETSSKFSALLRKAGTIIWNGPIGVFEFDQFEKGTKALSMAIAESDAFSIAGGGDTLAAIEKFHIEDKVSYISTGGGAFLEFLEGKKLPAVAILEERAAH